MDLASNSICREGRQLDDCFCTVFRKKGIRLIHKNHNQGFHTNP